MITKKTYSDGSWGSYAYDALNHLLGETKQNNSSMIYSNTYTYDPVGNRLTWTNNGTLRSYNYDAANRLTNWGFTANGTTQTDSYTYDNNGNRLTKSVAITGQPTQQTSYGYDFENRLNQLTYTNIPGITGTQTDNYTYSAEGLRVQGSINNVISQYSYDGSNVLLEKDVSGNITKSYTRAVGAPGGISGLIAQNYPSGNNIVTQYYDYNDLGSVADTTTSTGTAVSDYSYDAFGNLLTPQASGDANRYIFSTKELDSRSGLSYFGNRYYDPEIGRWLTPDPLGFINGLNRYEYAYNSPVNYIDPLGLYNWQTQWWSNLATQGAANGNWLQSIAGNVFGTLAAMVPDAGGLSGGGITGSGGIVGSVGATNMTFAGSEGCPERNETYTTVGAGLGTPQTGVNAGIALGWANFESPTPSSFTGNFTEGNISIGDYSITLWGGGGWTGITVGLTAPKGAASGSVQNVNYQPVN